MEPETKIALFRLFLCMPILLVSVGAILGWRSRYKPASASSALMLTLIPGIALIGLAALGEWKNHLQIVVSILVTALFFLSAPWCLFFAWRARKTGDNKTVATCALAISGFLLIPLTGLTCVSLWMFVTSFEK
ncbi:MAG TPA: hypothetical protein VGH19_15820 [Verrucomicrobiae bacterium]